MFSNVLSVIEAIVILGLIVMFHEFGHYVMGRVLGIGVLEFSVGFGPRLLGWKRKGIDYSLRAFPLGGFCRFASVEDGQAERDDAMEKQPVWKRFLTILSGPLMNFVLAYLAVFVILVGFGVEQVESAPIVATVSEDMPASLAGFLPEDVIIEANGQGISGDLQGVMDLQTIITENGEGEMRFAVDRGGERVEMSVTPRMTDDGETTRPMIGITFGSQSVGTYHYGFFEAFPAGWNYMMNFTGMMLESLKNLVFHGEGLDEVTGPVGIVSFMSVQVREGWYMVFFLIFLLSLNLGIMNLLPLPGLDGGRLVFLAVEAVRRKPVPPEKEGMVHGIGLLLLFVLILAITFKDVINLVKGWIAG